jgi:hypothetical protein
VNGGSGSPGPLVSFPGAYTGVSAIPLSRASIRASYPHSARAGPLDQHLLAAVELHSPGAFRLAGVSAARGHPLLET